MASRSGESSSEAAAGQEAIDSPSLDQALPREMLMLIVADHMHDRSDVKRLSLTSRSFFRLISSPELVAAWLWERHGNTASFLAMRNDDMAVFRQLIEVQRADVNALDDNGWGLLHLASSEGKVKYVIFLLRVPEIQVNSREYLNGWTAHNNMHVVMGIRPSSTSYCSIQLWTLASTV